MTDSLLPEADALEQAVPVSDPGIDDELSLGADDEPSLGIEVPEADALEQARVEPRDDDDRPR